MLILKKEISDIETKGLSICHSPLVRSAPHGINGVMALGLRDWGILVGGGIGGIGVEVDGDSPIAHQPEIWRANGNGRTIVANNRHNTTVAIVVMETPRTG